MSRWAVALLFVTQPLAAAGALKASSVHGFADVNLYFDVRGYSTWTTNTLLLLPGRLQYFQFTNIEGGFGQTDPSGTSGYYSEQNLRWAPLSGVPFDFALQFALRGGPDNDSFRAGGRLRVHQIGGLSSWFEKHHIRYMLSVFPLQLDHLEGGYEVQVEHVYRWEPFAEQLEGRLYLAGFLDHNLSIGAGGVTGKMVSEHQLGGRLWRGLHVVSELRVNSYLPRRRAGVAWGVQYLVVF